MSEFLFDQYGDQKILAERAKKDINGLSLELTVADDKVTEIGGLPVGAEDGEWIDHTFNAIEDDNGGTLLDDDGHPIGDDESTTLWKSYNGTEFLAKRTESDINGNSLVLSIENGRVLEIGGKPVGPEEGEWVDRTLNSLEDDNGGVIQDDNGEPIGDANSVTLWESYEGTKFLAERASNDANGNSLELHIDNEGKIDQIGGRDIAGGGASPVDAYTKTETNALLADKVDVESGKGLSTEDYTTTEKNKLAGIEAGAEKNVHANWTVTDYDDPGFIIGKPNVPKDQDYNYATFNLNPPYNYNCHVITSDDITRGYFYVSLPLVYTTSVSHAMLIGDVYGFRYIRDNVGKRIKSTDLTSLDLMLGDGDGNPIGDAHFIRKIDSSVFTLSDVNSAYNVRNSDVSPSQCRFHFMHIGASTSNMMPIDTRAANLLIKVNLASNTQMQANDKFEIHVAFVQF